MENQPVDEQVEIAEKYYVGHEFEVLKYRHEEQVKLLQVMGQVDLQVFSGYLTIQLAFGSFLIQQIVSSSYIKLGVLCVELSISLLCFILLRNNYLRRKEVVETVKNCNVALGLAQIGAFLPGKAINAPTRFRPWFHWYSVGIALSFVGVMFILLRPSETGVKTKVTQTVTGLTIGTQP